MATLTVENDAASIASQQHLAGLLHVHQENLRTERPVLAELVLDNGDVVNIGLGADISVLLYTNANLEPPYFRSRAEGPVDTALRALEFDVDGVPTEFERSDAVPVERAIEAAVDCYSTRTRSALVAWQEV